MKRIKTIIPDGCPCTRIRATSRVTRRLEDGGTLGDTLNVTPTCVVLPKRIVKGKKKTSEVPIKRAPARGVL